MAIVLQGFTNRKLKINKGEVRDGIYIHSIPESQIGGLKENLDYEVKRLKQRWDVIAVVDGVEGSGKTTLAKTVSGYMAAGNGIRFGLNDVIFTIGQFHKWMETAPPGSACMWDEFVLAGMSTDGLTRIQNELIKQFTVLRKRQLIIILVIPYFFMLRRYFAMDRPRFLLHVYSPDNLNRGFFKYYGKGSLNELYVDGKKYSKYYRKPDFSGDFHANKDSFFPDAEYEKKKDEIEKMLNKGEDELRSEENLGYNKPYVNHLVKVITHLRFLGYTWEYISKTCLDYQNSAGAKVFYQQHSAMVPTELYIKTTGQIRKIDTEKLLDKVVLSSKSKRDEWKQRRLNKAEEIQATDTNDVKDKDKDNDDEEDSFEGDVPIIPQPPAPIEAEKKEKHNLGNVSIGLGLQDRTATKGIEESNEK